VTDRKEKNTAAKATKELCTAETQSRRHRKT